MTSLLDRVERLGNRLPDPLYLFAGLAAAVLVASAAAAQAGVAVTHPGTGEVVAAQSLLTPDGLRRVFVEAVRNFTSFPPLGTVLVAMLGIGVAERSGLVAAVLTGAVRVVPGRLLAAALVFLGVNASVAADAGFVLLVPLGAAAYASVGRHPLAGLAVAFAGVSGGFSANLAITALDPLLAGLTEAGARLVEPTATVRATDNWYFMVAGTFVLTAVGALVADRVVEPRLGPWTPSAELAVAPEGEAIPPERARAGLRAAGAGLVAVALGVAGLAAWGVFRDEAGWKPLFDAMVPLVGLAFLVPGLLWGHVTGRARGSRAVAAVMAEAMQSMSGYLVLAFAAAQFIAWFGWSNLGLITAVTGAGWLADAGLEGPILLVGFVLVSATMNLFIASASAKWAIMAPVFVPMLLLVGVSPAATQAAYRVGDSITNLITPLMPYFPLILAFARRWAPGVGLGTILGVMIPYSLAFLVAWTALLLGWVVLDLPLGPGAGIRWPPAGADVVP